jgi:hypothetical protein
MKWNVMNLLTLKIEIKDQNVFVLINENKKTRLSYYNSYKLYKLDIKFKNACQIVFIK